MTHPGQNQVPGDEIGIARAAANRDEKGEASGLAREVSGRLEKTGAGGETLIGRGRSTGRFGVVLLSALVAASCALLPGTADSPHKVIQVPRDFPTLQEAIDAAGGGETILVAPGLYRENLRLAGKSVTLASWSHTTGDLRYIDQTILDGQGGSYVIQVAESAGPETTIIGFTIRNGEDGVLNFGSCQLFHNRFTENEDGLECEGGSAVCRFNVFENNRDDGIDMDGPSQIVVEENLIRNNADDGVAVRLHEYAGPFLEIVIRRNKIYGNAEDGIQLVDYPALSSRVFRIEFNVIAHNGMAGLGMMSGGKSAENFEGAGIPERIYLLNNTFFGNDYGVSGGHNVIALNNIIAGSRNMGIRNMKGNSVGSHLLFWNNGADYESSNIHSSNLILEDPLLDADYRPSPGSPVIDAGTAAFQWDSEIVLNRAPEEYAGSAPDLGAVEFPQGKGN